MKTPELYNIFRATNGIATDTRKIDADTLFFALKGPNFNGNAYASQALEKGAAFAVIDDAKFKTSEKYILVDDVLQSLQNLANYHRKHLAIPVLGIAGSNGKTTTKELINAVLRTKFKTFATKGNLNNHIGVPLSLLAIDPSFEMAVLELGANHVGELATLCQIAEPSHGLITNNGLDHLEGYGSFEGVVQGNSEIFDWLLKNAGTPFVNSHDEILLRMATRFHQPYTYGGESDTSWATILENNFFIKVLTNKGVQIQTQLVGEYNLDNINTALAVAQHFGVDHEAACRAVVDYKPANNRSQLIEKGSNKIILDCYNANPSSMRLSIESFAKMNLSNKALLLGDMYELGEFSQTEHQNVVDLIAKHDFKAVLLSGTAFSQTQTSASIFYKFESRQEMETYLKHNPLKNFALLIKGSRGMALEKLVEVL